jgi:nitrile hydratase
MNTQQLPNIVKADGEEPVFKAGDRVIISSRLPLGHYRVPRYIRGKRCVIEAVIEPCWLNNEEEGFGRNAGQKRHYYRVAIPMADLWPGYDGFRKKPSCIRFARRRGGATSESSDTFYLPTETSKSRCGKLSHPDD